MAGAAHRDQPGSRRTLGASLRRAPLPDPDRDPLLADLTDAQREAVLHTEGPLLILAAAGSGKTRVITRRIAHLVRLGVAPWRILALTFTNKAAGEMRSRVAELLGGGDADSDARGLGPRGLTVTTFHSLCARLLRRYAPLANLQGVKADYTIYDTADQLALMKQVIGELGLSTTNWSPRSALSQISNAKNELKDASAFAAEATDFYARSIAKIYSAYEKALRRANAVDFDDLLLLTVRALQTCREAREEVKARWKHLMIDEYQDTNRAQFLLSTLLIGEHGSRRPGGAPGEAGEVGEAVGPNICVVGDPDQSIYGWRGADIRNILEFEQQWPSARVIALGQNFRSTAPILATADALIRNNKLRKHKDLYTVRAGGEKPEVVLCRDEHHEAQVVVDWLKTRRETAPADGPVMQWKDMAVFYRTNALSRVVEDALRAAGMPYVIARGTAFYEREEVKDALAYLRVVANPADEVSLRRIVNKPARGIGAASIGRLEGAALERGATLLEALRDAAGGGASDDVSNRAASAIGKFIATLDAWTGHGTFMGGEASGSLAELVERVIKESGLEKLYESRRAKGRAARSGAEGTEAPDEDRLGNLEELISSAAEFEASYAPDADPANDVAEGGASVPPLLAMLRAYLESVALVSDADKIDPAQGAVTLMTLHAAKGLEFRAVAMIGLEDGLLPHMRARESEAELEEERRLCFVGITRAMERLLITSARMRTHRGMRERTIVSQFLEELPADEVVVSDQSAPAWDEGWGAAGGGGSFGRRAGSGGEAVDDDWPPPEADDDGSGKGAQRGAGRARGGDAGPPFPPGAVVRHPQFGEGTIVSVTPGGANTRAQIRFRHVGMKTLVIQYARLERIG